jgi:cephalosporin hydroxylase
VIFVLDTNYSRKNLLIELSPYSQNLPFACYMIVCDTITEWVPSRPLPDCTCAPARGSADAVSLFLQKALGARLGLDLTLDLLINEVKAGILSKFA